MNPLDISILATMTFFVVRGIFRGLFREIGSLAGVILGIWLANSFQPDLTEYLRVYLPTTSTLPLISFGVIFAVVFTCCSFAGWGLRMLMKKALLGWMDRAMGAGLAVLKGLIITYFAIVLITFFVPSKAPLIADSKLAPIIISSYQKVVNLISPGAYRDLKDRFLGNGKLKAPFLKEKEGGKKADKV